MVAGGVAVESAQRFQAPVDNGNRAPLAIQQDEDAARAVTPAAHGRALPHRWSPAQQEALHLGINEPCRLSRFGLWRRRFPSISRLSGASHSFLAIAIAFLIASALLFGFAFTNAWI
jgi:hypothetical protein